MAGKADVLDACMRRLWHEGISKRDAQLVIDTFLTELAKTIRHDRVEIRGFGSFSMRDRAPRVARAPRTGERVEVPGRRVPHWKPCARLRAKLVSKTLR